MGGSLGRRYNMLETAVQVLPEKDKTLGRIMRMAVDHAAMLKENSGEADNSNVALLSQLHVGQKRTRESAFAASDMHGYHECTICGDKRHKKETCFKEGGGLSHLSAAQKGMVGPEAKTENDAMGAVAWEPCVDK